MKRKQDPRGPLGRKVGTALERWAESAAQGAREFMSGPEDIMARELEEQSERARQAARRRTRGFDKLPEDVQRMLEKGHTMEEIRGFERVGRQARCRDASGWQTLDPEQVRIELLAIPPGNKILFQYPEIRAAFIDAAGITRFIASSGGVSVLKKRGQKHRSRAGEDSAAIFEWDKKGRHIEIIVHGSSAELLERLYELACESVEGEIPSSY